MDSYLLFDDTNAILGVSYASISPSTQNGTAFCDLYANPTCLLSPEMFQNDDGSFTLLTWSFPLIVNFGITDGSFYSGTNFSAAFNTLQFGISVDSSPLAGQPWGLACAIAEDGTSFAGGFSSASSFCSIGVANFTVIDAIWYVQAPNRYSQTGSAIFPNRVVSVVKGANGQVADLEDWRSWSSASSGVNAGTTVARVEATGAMGTVKRLVSALPTCNSANEGLQAAVTDSTTATWGATITGSGSNHVLAYCNGTNWTVMAK
jgi:hypothetical protein